MSSWRFRGVDPSDLPLSLMPKQFFIREGSLFVIAITGRDNNHTAMKHMLRLAARPANQLTLVPS